MSGDQDPSNDVGTEDEHHLQPLNIATETRLYLELAIPTALLSMGFGFSQLLTASYVGLRFGPLFMSSFSLGNLTGNLCTMSLLQGVFSAADTLSPQAFAKADYREVGLIAMRGVFASVVILLPVNVLLLLYMEDALIALGQDPEAAHHATRWYFIYMGALPFFIVYTAAWKFLSSQHIMRPLIYISVFCFVVVLPVALEVLTRTHGFLGSAAALVVYQASQCLLLLLDIGYQHPHTVGTWPGLGCWKEALQVRPMLDYMHLATGGILAQSEWIYWEALGLIVGRMGVIPLSVHTIPNQMVNTLIQPAFAFGTALAIRMGHTLHSSVRHAKQIVAGVTVASSALFGVVSIAIDMQPSLVIGWFTTDEEVIELTYQIWGIVSSFLFIISVFGIVWGIATGLGMQWTLGAVNFFYLWIFGIPVEIYFALMKGGGVRAVWTWMTIPYTCMNITLAVIFVAKDWHKVSEEICARGSTSVLEEGEARQENGRKSEEQQGLLGGTSKAKYSV